MTHNDIYTKFMIEYDKANVTSSYPSLTEYEVATVLDKAYNALIAQKITGNNVRRASFETDVKSISDLAPLVVHKHVSFFDDSHIPAVNIKPFELPNNFNYYVQAYIEYIGSNNNYLKESEVYQPRASSFENIDNNPFVNKQYEVYYPDNGYGETLDSNDDTTELGIPYDKKETRLVPVKLVPHYVAEKFFTTSYNMPWVKIPVCYIELNVAYVVYDLLNMPIVSDGSTVHLTYIRKPNTFVKNLDEIPGGNGTSFFQCPDNATDEIKEKYNFECNNTMAEELISLAISFALENVESQRLNSKLNMRGLEA